jgi:preprotein translocase subunit SecF
MELLGKTNIDFIGRRNIAFVISAVISIIGIFGIVQITLGNANMGIDFSGGTAMQLKFNKPFSIADARTALHKHGIAKADLQEIKDGNKLLVKMAGAAVGKPSEMVQESFRKEFADNPFTVESSTEIGPSIGDKLRKDTLVAVVISLVGIVLYIAWRFDFKFGIGATLATMHDCLAMVAVFFIMGKEINLLFITAVLTLDKIFNDSINEVLSRTIVTSLTVLLASASLFLFGGEVIHDFAFALLVGVLAGTYSSIFVASPIVVLLENRALAKQADKP